VGVERALPRCVGLLVLVLLPGAGACTLAYQPIDHVTFDGELMWYVDGTSLRVRRGALDAEVANAFALSYVPLPDDGLLVAGQDGLGSDCSGRGWVELRRGGHLVWRQEERPRETDSYLVNDPEDPHVVFAHPQGPFVQTGRQVWRLEGDELVEWVDLPDHGWLIGWTADARPILNDGEARTVQVGDVQLTLSANGFIWDVATDGRTTALVERRDWRDTVLHLVEDGRASNVTWTPPEGFEPGVAWAGGAWIVGTGSRAYRVAGGSLTDLGVADVIHVAAQGDRAAVFTEEGYVVFDGTVAVEAWKRDGNLWTPTAVGTEPPRGHAAQTAGPQDLPPAPAAGQDAGSGSSPIPVPGLPPLAALALLSVAAGLRRRRG
jgi:uncharacterized protein (TIGR03382 family)